MRVGDDHPRRGEAAAPSIWEPRIEDSTADGVAPAVLHPEHFDDEPTEVVFVPCQRITRGDTQAHVHLRYTDTDQLALLVFSSLDELVTAFGERQAWISVPAHTVADLVGQTGAEVVLYDTAPQQQEGEAQR